MRSLAAGFLSAAITDWHSAVRASEGMRLCTARQKPLSWRSYFDSAFALMKNTKIRGWENAEVGIGSQFLICSTVQPPNFGFLDIASSDSWFGQIFNLEQPPTTIVGSGIGADAAPRMIQLKLNCDSDGFKE